MTATLKSTTPTATTAIRLVTAQSGMCAVDDDVDDQTRITATRSNTRCAKTVPSSRAQARLPAVDAGSAPRRARARRLFPGASRSRRGPTENAEKTSMKLGCGGSKACTMTVRHASVRASTESRFSPTAAATQFHSTALNTSPTAPQAGPRHQRSSDHADGGEHDDDRCVRPAVPNNVHGARSPARRSRRAGVRSSRQE